MIKEFKDLLSNKDDLDILFKQPPLYKMKNLKTGEIPNALYTNEQLQII